MRTPCKGDLHIPWGDPVRERRIANLVSESDHAGDGLPTVLAKPEKVKYHPLRKKELHIVAKTNLFAYQPFVPTLPVQVPVPSETLRRELIDQKGKAGRTVVGSTRVVVVEVVVA